MEEAGEHADCGMVVQVLDVEVDLGHLADRIAGSPLLLLLAFPALLSGVYNFVF